MDGGGHSDDGERPRPPRFVLRYRDAAALLRRLGMEAEARAVEAQAEERRRTGLFHRRRRPPAR